MRGFKRYYTASIFPPMRRSLDGCGKLEEMITLHATYSSLLLPHQGILYIPGNIVSVACVFVWHFLRCLLFYLEFPSVCLVVWCFRRHVFSFGFSNGIYMCSFGILAGVSIRLTLSINSILYIYSSGLHVGECMHSTFSLESISAVCVFILS